MSIKGYKFNIYRSVSGEEFEKIAEVTGNVFEFEDIDIEANKEYSYKVTAIDLETGVESDPTNPVTITVVAEEPPTTPNNLSASSSGNQVELIWEPSLPGSNPIAGYRIWRATENYDYISIGFTENTSYIDSNLAANVTYYYKVSCVDIKGLESDHCSPVSTSVSGVPLDVPQNISGEVGANAVKISWSEVTNARFYDIYKNDVFLARTSNKYYVDFDDSHNINAYKVRAVGRWGNTSHFSSEVYLASIEPTVSITFPSSFPYTFTTLEIKISGETQPSFSIDYIEIKIRTGLETEYVHAPADSTFSWKTVGCNGLTYYVSLRAVPFYGNPSSWTEEKTITINAPYNVYYYSSGAWTPVSNVSDITVTSSLNKASTATININSKELTLKDRVMVQRAGVYFQGIVLSCSYKDDGTWTYECIDYSYYLQRIPISILSDDWKTKTTIGNILKALFKSAQDKGFIEYNIKLNLTEDYNIGELDITNYTIWEVLENFSSITGDKFYYNLRHNYLYFGKIAETDSGIDFEYGTSSSSWNIEERRENICNSLELDYQINDKPLNNSFLTEATENIILGFNWSYQEPASYFRVPEQTPYLDWFSTIAWPFSVWQTVGEPKNFEPPDITSVNPYAYPVFRSIIKYPFPEQTLTWKFIVTRKGTNIGNLRVWFHVFDRGTYNYVFRAPPAGFIWPREWVPEGYGVELGFNTKFGIPEGGFYPGRYEIWVGFEPTSPGDPYNFYLLHGAIFTLKENLMENYNRYPIDAFFVNQATGHDGYKDRKYVLSMWTAQNNQCRRYWGTGTPNRVGKKIVESPQTPFDGISLFYPNTKVISLFGNINVKDYSYISMRLKGYVKVTATTTTNKKCVWYIHSNPALGGDALEEVYLDFYSGARDDPDTIENVQIIDNLPNPTLDQEDVIQTIEIENLLPLSSISDFKFIGKKGKITKTILDYLPSSTSIIDYGLQHQKISKEFSTYNEALKYIQTYLINNHEPYISGRLTIPYIVLPSIGSLLDVDLPDYSGTKKISSVTWNLVEQTTEIILDAEPPNPVAQSLKALQKEIKDIKK